MNYANNNESAVRSKSITEDTLARFAPPPRTMSEYLVEFTTAFANAVTVLGLILILLLQAFGKTSAASVAANTCCQMKCESAECTPPHEKDAPKKPSIKKEPIKKPSLQKAPIKKDACND